MRVIFASTNPGKLQEVTAVLSVHGHEVVDLTTYGLDLDVEETGTSLEENALLKLNAACDLLNLDANIPVIADDTGFSITALGGEPGIYVRRWRDKRTEMDDQGIIDFAMERMNGVDNRKAHMTAVIACRWQGETTLMTGSLNGHVVTEPTAQTHPGFPLEAIFYVDEWNMMLGDQHNLSPDERAKLPTHRGRALSQVVNLLDRAR